MHFKMLKLFSGFVVWSLFASSLVAIEITVPARSCVRARYFPISGTATSVRMAQTSRNPSIPLDVSKKIRSIFEKHQINKNDIFRK